MSESIEYVMFTMRLTRAEKRRTVAACATS